MKHFKSIILIVLIIMGWAIHANAQDNQEPAKLSDEQKRFDLNGDGKLSDAENEIMLRVTSIEGFTGNKFSREEIERMQRGMGTGGGFGGPGGMPGFGGGGGRRGPRPSEKLVDQFDKDKDGKLTGAERQAALDTRGGGSVTPLNKTILRDGVQNDMKASLTSVPEGSPPLYDTAHTPHTPSAVSPRRLV